MKKSSGSSIKKTCILAVVLIILCTSALVISTEIYSPESKTGQSPSVVPNNTSPTFTQPHTETPEKPKQQSEQDIPKEPIIPDSLNVLVDKTHALPRDFEPKDLVKLIENEVSATDNSIMLRNETATQLRLMLGDMRSQGNRKLSVISGYRSYSVQEYTYNSWVARLGQERADVTSAKPGHSEHQLGTTVDLGLAGTNDLNSLYPGQATREWTWLDQNAHNYGFVMSYRYKQEHLTGYKFEPWHWRYVGKNLAIQIRKSTNTPQSFYKPLN